MTDERDRALRRLAFGVAYRMLGSVSEAEDVVQETLLRLHDEPHVRNPEAFVTTVATRLSIDVLRSARARREAFDYGFAEIAEIVGRSEANCRQILSRARRRVEDGRPRFDAEPEQRRALAARFLDAARDGNLDGLIALLAPEAVLVGDGGGKARAIPRPMVGAAAIARALRTFYELAEQWGVTLEPALVNGQPGFRSIAPDGRLVNVVGLHVEGGRVTRIFSILNPDKLDHLGPVSDVALRPSLG